ncbi:DNA packaging protein [Sinsheimervirus phiX174]|uniref:J protein n=1 Tax=Escherichia phage phiX174 TaxID=10847 RepID=A0A2Z5HTW0_BPPHX|nr:DNA packaging protein [Sinsheimervirus phiX174]
MSKGKKRSGARPGRPQPLRGTKVKRKGAHLWYGGVQQF